LECAGCFHFRGRRIRREVKKKHTCASLWMTIALRVGCTTLDRGRENDAGWHKRPAQYGREKRPHPYLPRLTEGGHYTTEMPHP